MLTKQPVSYYQPSVMLTCIDGITKKLSKRVTNRLSHRWAYFFPDAVLTLITNLYSADRIASYAGYEKASQANSLS